MYEVGMSSRGGSEDLRNSNLQIGPNGNEPLQVVDPALFDENDDLGFIVTALKTGILCLICLMLFGAYQLIPPMNQMQQIAKAQIYNKFDPQPITSNESDDFVVPVAREFVSAPKLDMMATGSIKIEEKPKSKKPKISIESLAAGGEPYSTEIYTVKSGDTLSGIAQKYRMKSKDIIAVNEIKNPSLIKPGMRIIIAR